ncbi:MAG: hypothetical protein AAB800_00500 [Patescibacteria group bacterium]
MAEGTGLQEMSTAVVEDPVVKASQEMRDQAERDRVTLEYLKRVQEKSGKEKVGPMDISKQLLKDLADKSDPKAYMDAVKVLTSGVHRVFAPILFPRPKTVS